MSSKFKSKARLSSSDSDSDADVKPAKKQKKEKKPEKKSKADEGEEEGEHMYAISKNRFINVRDFKGKVLIDIREYYNDATGDLKPGRKGISLSAEQWKKLVEKVDEVNESISEIA